MKTQENFDEIRAKYNLMESVKYKAILEWVSRMLKQGIYSNEQIAQEIDHWLKEESNKARL